MSEPEWIIETHDLCRTYGDGELIRALDNINLKVAKGELLAVMGPSGSGKSTLLNVLGALDKPTSGKVVINGQDLAKIESLDQFRSQTVGFVFQLHNLLPTLSSLENVEVPMMGKLSAGERHERAEELLTLVGMGDRMKHLPGQLSGGQRQRVAVARALANKPLIVLADEPTGNLDSVSGNELMGLIASLNRSQGTTFVVVTHDLNVARQTRRVVMMEDGRIVRDDRIGSPLEEDLKVWAASELGRSIIKGDNQALHALGITSEQLEALQAVFVANEGGQNQERPRT